MTAEWDNRLSFNVTSTAYDEPNPEAQTQTVAPEKPVTYETPEMSNSFVGEDGLVEEQNQHQLNVQELVEKGPMSVAEAEAFLAEGRNAQDVATVRDNQDPTENNRKDDANEQLAEATDAIKGGIAGAMGFKTDEDEKEKSSPIASIAGAVGAAAFVSTLSVGNVEFNSSDTREAGDGIMQFTTFMKESGMSAAPREADANSITLMSTPMVAGIGRGQESQVLG